MLLRRRAPAKLNLYLHILGRRTDGFHELDSLVAFASIGDDVAVEASDTLTLSVTGPFAGDLESDPQRNLIWRAAEALAARIGVVPRAAISLAKNLPVASGIGGGSSDAAACLRLLAELWDCDDAKLLTEVASSLGSDVPACLAARPVWVGGIGDRVEAAPSLPACGVLLVNPCIALPTAPVYRAFAGPFSAPARFEMLTDAAGLAAQLAARRNDLTTPALSMVPAIGTVLERLAALDHVLLARMSGSGATCFALFATEDEAHAAADSLAAEHFKWWITSGRLLAD